MMIRKHLLKFLRQPSRLTQAEDWHEQKSHSVISSPSSKLTQLICFFSTLARSIKYEDERYKLLKTVYWSLPRFIRRRLDRQRYAYIMKKFQRNFFILGQNNLSTSDPSIKQSDWLIRANQAAHIAVISSSFEFDELFNQRSINSAKYFAAQGYFVLLVVWQMSPKNNLSKGCSEVWPNIYQVPLFDFILQVEKIYHHKDFSIFIATIPAFIFVNIVPCLRQRGLAIVYDIIDEWEAFHYMGQATWFTKPVETSLVLQSDYVCAVSPSLRDKFSFLRLDINVIGNGYSPDVIGLEYKGIARTQRGDQPVIGYFGHLTDAWFDWRLVFHLAVNRKDVIFEIIGYGEPEWARRETIMLPNVRLLGKVLPKDLHCYTVGWSAAFIPFIEGILAEAVDPIKIYEYLYFGLPTIVTGIKHLKDYPLTYFADRQNIFVVLDQVLQSKLSMSELDYFLKKTTWCARFDTLLSEVSRNQNMRRLYAN